MKDIVLNNQQIFDKVATHLLTQKARSLGINGECSYRGLNGTKCAIGCLIPDELYSPTMEGCGVYAGQVGNLFDFSLCSCDLLFMLQSTHDKNQVEVWDELLINVAKANQLDYNIVNTLTGKA